MENKQTAVEWLINKTESLISIETFQEWKELKEQAIGIEKEQIMDAYAQGIADDAGEIIDATKDAEQYYRDTYGE